MIKIRFTATVLAVVLIFSMMIPISATSSFSDISDAQTAIDADVLRLMGVVDGVGSNQFNPTSTLTRAAFCKMIIAYMGITDQLPLYETRTIFSDVPASHWGASYINLAASTANGDSNLIAGVGDGSFRPDSVITFGQAVTVLVRILGYSDGDTGAIWPIGYLNLASSIGLTQGLSLSATDAITRSDAAQLFVQALSTKTKSGTYYYDTLGSSIPDVMILATNITDDSGVSGAIRTSTGTYSTAVSNVNPIALQGCRGNLVLNEKNQIITFLPDDSTSVRISLTSNPQATYLNASNGKRYTIASTTPVYTYGAESNQGLYSDLWTDLQSGDQITLFLDGSTVAAIYCGVSETAEDAVVVTGTANRSQFYSLTGGSTDFTILRNGATIDVTDLVKYDVVTYDPTINALIASDLRINAVFESGSPNSTTPTSIQILGHNFPVLDGALDQSDQIKVGGTASFLLTADGSIAAMKTVSRSYPSTVYGIAGSNSVEVQLPAGGSITLTGSESISDSNQGRLVTVSSSYAGKMSVARMNSGSAGTFDVTSMTLGGRSIAPNFALFEEVAGGMVTPLPITALDMDSIPSADIATYRTDASGNVDLIVLDGVTGDSYTYGMLIETPAENSGDSLSASNRMVSVVNGGDGLSNLVTNVSFADGVFGGVAQGVNRNAQAYASSVILLTAVDGISRGDFFTVDNTTYVTVNGTSYPVADQVVCYNEDSGTWTSLSALRGYTDTLTIYMDEMSNTVRVVTATEK